jgi:molybdopterin-guanine dinucleotide biosynthesis protein A
MDHFQGWDEYGLRSLVRLRLHSLKLRLIPDRWYIEMAGSSLRCYLIPNASSRRPSGYGATLVTAGIVLAGGRSSRLGRNKATAMIGGRTLLEGTVDALLPIVDEIIIAGPKMRGSRLSASVVTRWVEDQTDGDGPLVGACSALAVSRSDLNVIVACDMPFLNAALLGHLLTLAETNAASIVAPVIDGVLQPTHSIYRRDCLSTMQAALKEGERSLVKLLNMIPTLRVSPEECRPFDPTFLSFFNINTPDDLKRARRLVSLARVRSRAESIESDPSAGAS